MLSEIEMLYAIHTTGYCSSTLRDKLWLSFNKPDSIACGLCPIGIAICGSSSLSVQQYTRDRLMELATTNPEDIIGLVL